MLSSYDRRVGDDAAPPPTDERAGAHAGANAVGALVGGCCS